MASQARGPGYESYDVSRRLHPAGSDQVDAPESRMTLLSSSLGTLLSSSLGRLGLLGLLPRAHLPATSRGGHPQLCLGARPLGLGLSLSRECRRFLGL